MEKALSISSIHNIQGANASAISIICRTLLSDSPTIPANNLPTSSRNNGSFQSFAIAFTVIDFPVPCIPPINKPFGEGNP